MWILTLMLSAICGSVKQIHGTIPMFTTNFSMIQFNITLSLSYTHTHTHLGFPMWFLRLKFYKQNFLWTSCSPTWASSPVHLNFLDLTTLKLACEDHKLCSLYQRLPPFHMLICFPQTIQCSWTASIYCFKWSCFHFILFP